MPITCIFFQIAFDIVLSQITSISSFHSTLSDYLPCLLNKSANTFYLLKFKRLNLPQVIRQFATFHNSSSAYLPAVFSICSSPWQGPQAVFYLSMTVSPRPHVSHILGEGRASRFPVPHTSSFPDWKNKTFLMKFDINIQCQKFYQNSKFAKHGTHLHYGIVSKTLKIFSTLLVLYPRH